MKKTLKVRFTRNYFNPKLCAYNHEQVDVTLYDKKGSPLLYIEAKLSLNHQERKKP